jgi:hypothetical protein
LAAPVQKILDNGTGGWALSAANLGPDYHQTIIGQVFLATNIRYAATGLVLTVKSDLRFGLLTDLVAIASFNYHYEQLLTTRTSSRTTKTKNPRFTMPCAL